MSLTPCGLQTVICTPDLSQAGASTARVTDMNFFKGHPFISAAANYITLTTHQDHQGAAHHLQVRLHHRALKLVFALFIAYHPELQDRMRQPVPHGVLHPLHSGRLCCNRRSVEGCVPPLTAWSTPCCALSPLSGTGALLAELTPATRCGSSASCASGSLVPPWCCSWPL